MPSVPLGVLTNEIFWLLCAILVTLSPLGIHKLFAILDFFRFLTLSSLPIALAYLFRAILAIPCPPGRLRALLTTQRLLDNLGPSWAFGVLLATRRSPGYLALGSMLSGRAGRVREKVLPFKV